MNKKTISKVKIPVVKIHGDSLGSSSDVKDSSGSDCSTNLQSKLQKSSNTKEAKPKHALKARVIPSRYKAAAIEATRKGLSNSSDSSRAKSPFDKNRGKTGSLATGSSRSPNISKLGIGMTGNSNLRLHSTAVNCSTFFEKTDFLSPQAFSTTIVGGQNRGPSYKANSIDSVTPLSDISEICPTPSTTMIAAPSNKKSDDDQSKRYTVEDLKKAYLEYLSWEYIDIRSGKASEKQVKEAEKQIAFLTQLVEQEEEKVSEERRKLKLIDEYYKTCQNHTRIKDELFKLNETVAPCAHTIKDLTHHLEHQINQVKLENIYIPSDESVYKKSLQDVIEDTCNTLKDLNSNLQDSKSLLQSAAPLFENVVEESEKIGSCVMLSEKVANLAIEESSLKLARKF